MEVLKDRNSLNSYISSLKLNKKSIGFVPTMGFLHNGHHQLILESKQKTDVTLVSIFVNPTQFDKKNDFESYPKNTEMDLKNCENLGVGAVFLPNTDSIYPNGFPQIFMKIPHLMENLCAKHRKGHMEGVLNVVSILLHLIQADYAFFGKKDYQQYLLVKYLCDFLTFPTKIIGVETYREQNGLAMSSRNSRLTEVERKEASLIFEILQSMKEMIVSKNINLETMIKQTKEKIEQKGWVLDYLEILDAKTLQKLEKTSEKLLIAIAVFIRDIRLIDNLEVEI